MPAGVLALGVASAVWLAVAGRVEVGGQIPASITAGAATVLGLVLAGLVAVVVWLAQRSDQRRRVAESEAARRAEAEAQAQDGEKRLFQFLGAIPAGVFIASPGGRPYYANRESERVLGRGVTDTSGSRLAETYGVFVAGTDRLYPAESMPIVCALRGESSHLDDQEIHQPDGTVIPIEIWGRPVYGSDGEVSYAIAAFADMSERNARERTIAGQAALLELAHDAIFVRDRDRRITYWNAGAEQTYGFTRAEAMGRTCHQMLRTRFPEPLAGIEATLARHNRWEGELTQRRSDGRTIVTESRWAAQRGPDGSLLGFMEVNRDITARKDAEREMRRAAEEIRALNATLEQQVQQRTADLLRSNQELEGFSYSVAHDLRAPLRAIHGYCQILLDDHAAQLDVDGQVLLGNVERYAERMGHLIEDLLALAKVGRKEPGHVPIDMTALAESVAADLRAGHAGTGPRSPRPAGRCDGRSRADPAGLGEPDRQRGEIQREPGGRPGQRGVPGRPRGSHLPRARQRRRLRHGLRREAFRGLPAPARRRLPRHRHRPGHRRPHRGTPRRPGLGRRPCRRRRVLHLHPPGRRE